MTKQEAEERYWFQTKPVAHSLGILSDAGLLDYVEGNTKGTSLYPFVVRLNEPLNDGNPFVCKATELHRIAKGVQDKAA